MNTIIFNADVGEEAGFDAEIMPFITWCNIACGEHAGNDKVIQETIELAIKNNVKIGAHPSYPDRKNFGRIKMDMPYQNLVDIVTDQIGLVKSHVEKAGTNLHHIKPHGALYNEAFKNEEVASVILESIKNIDKRLFIITQKESKLSYLAQGDFRVKHEVFADRNYNEDVSLVSRSEKNAVLTNAKEIFDHVLRMVSKGKVKTKNGVEVPVGFDTICVHGDNPKAVQILQYLHQEFSLLNLL